MTSEALFQIRKEEQRKAAQELGVERVIFMGNEDGELEVTLERRKAITRLIREYQPEVLVTHDPWMRYQLHPDHRASGTLALDAMISARDRLYFQEQFQENLNPWRVRRVLLFASDQADVFIDISSTLEKKIKALGHHRSQVSQWPRWEEWMRKRAETAATPQGLKFAEPFKKLTLS